MSVAKNVQTSKLDDRAVPPTYLGAGLGEVGRVEGDNPSGDTSPCGPQHGGHRDVQRKILTDKTRNLKHITWDEALALNI